MKGRHHSPETIAKLSAAKSGKPNLLLRGYRHSPEARSRMGCPKGHKQSPEHIAKKAAAQRGKHYNLPIGPCAICGLVRGLYKDHCHATGARRDMLCGRCNTALGNFDDNPERLEAAAAYIRKHRLAKAV